MKTRHAILYNESNARRYDYDDGEGSKLGRLHKNLRGRRFTLGYFVQSFYFSLLVRSFTTPTGFSLSAVTLVHSLWFVQSDEKEKRATRLVRDLIPNLLSLSSGLSCRGKERIRKGLTPKLDRVMLIRSNQRRDSLLLMNN